MVRKNMQLSDDIINGIRYHHEMVDGTGYPAGLRANEIPLYSRIIAIADTYNALTSDRPYRGKYTPLEALAIMEEEYWGKLDTGIMYTFTTKIKDSYVGQKVRTKNGLEGDILMFTGKDQVIVMPSTKLPKTVKITEITEFLD